MFKYLLILCLYLCCSLSVQAEPTQPNITISTYSDSVDTKQFINAPTRYTVRVEGDIPSDRAEHMQLQYILALPIVGIDTTPFVYDQQSNSFIAQLTVTPFAEYAGYTTELDLFVDIPPADDMVGSNTIIPTTGMYIALQEQSQAIKPSLLDIDAPLSFMDTNDMVVTLEYDRNITSFPISQLDIKLKPFNTDYTEVSYLKIGNQLEITLHDVYVLDPGYKSSIVIATPTKFHITPCKSTLQTHKDTLYTLYGIEVVLDNTRLHLEPTFAIQPLNDIAHVNTILELILLELGKYPPNFINELVTTVNNLYLAFGQYETGTLSGLTGIVNTPQEQGVYMLLINHPELDNKTVHHELFHVIEYALYFKNPTVPFGNAFAEWDSLNPYDFTYLPLDLVTNEYTLTNTANKGDIYFINRYAKTSPYEDRATLFSEMVVQSKGFAKTLDISPLKRKSNYLAYVLGAYFESLKVEVVSNLSE